jgi:primosomal protein N''
MKTFTDFIQLNESPELEQLDEVTLKTWTSVALTAKVRSLQNQITSIKIRPNESLPSSMIKLFQKLDLISNQNFINSILISQTSIQGK